ncbi:hypothetical protein DUI87_24358 [Hirundo rustica rustica]|uniref:Core shell protein Gag P30 domain-containing protein n=1 Tax=Hirundo rustica rustica TaxID=333673 RepID=A0A3M0JEA9_HIRRU|nr:hypothetical protein DUI87_24358 [Hirundo rustica rustica]
MSPRKNNSLEPGAANCEGNSQEPGIPGNSEGGSQEGSILQDSPLGMMLQYWDALESQMGKRKQKMINYYMFEWTKEMIGKDNLHWPKSGSFEDWICQSLNLYMNSKELFNQEESKYAALWLPRGKGDFVTRRQGIKGFPFYPLQTRGQAAKKDRHEPQDPLDHLPPPYRQPNQPVQPQAPEVPPINANAPPIQEEPVAHRTRGEGMGRSDDGDGEAKMEDGLYPLRKVPMANPEQRPIGDVSVPLNTGDVRELKKEMGRLLEDPLGVAERLDQFLCLNIYTRVELQSILGILFTMEERETLRHSGMRVWDREC